MREKGRREEIKENWRKRNEKVAGSRQRQRRGEIEPAHKERKQMSSLKLHLFLCEGVTAYVWESEDNLWDLVLSFCVDSRG